MFSIHTTVAVIATTFLTWAFAAFFALFGLCSADPFGDYQGSLSEQLIEIKLDIPEVPSIKMAPPDDIETLSQTV